MKSSLYRERNQDHGDQNEPEMLELFKTISATIKISLRFREPSREENIELVMYGTASKQTHIGQVTRLVIKINYA